MDTSTINGSNDNTDSSWFLAIAFNEDGYQKYLNKNKKNNEEIELNEVVVENGSLKIIKIIN